MPCTGDSTEAVHCQIKQCPGNSFSIVLDYKTLEFVYYVKAIHIILCMSVQVAHDVSFINPELLPLQRPPQISG